MNNTVNEKIIDVKFHVKPSWEVGKKVFYMVQVTCSRLPPCLSMVKTFKNLLRGGGGVRGALA